MIDWTPYLKSISDSEKYAQWETFYTLTDVEGKTRNVVFGAKKFSYLKDGVLYSHVWIDTLSV